MQKDFFFVSKENIWVFHVRLDFLRFCKCLRRVMFLGVSAYFWFFLLDKQQKDTKQFEIACSRGPLEGLAFKLTYEVYTDDLVS